MNEKEIHHKLFELLRFSNDLRYGDKNFERKEEFADFISIIERALPVLNKIQFFIFVSFLTKLIENEVFYQEVLDKNHIFLMERLVPILKKDFNLVENKLNFIHIIDRLVNKNNSEELSLQEISVVIKDLKIKKETVSDIDIKIEEGIVAINEEMNKDVDLTFLTKLNYFLLIYTIIAIYISNSYNLDETMIYLTMEEYIFVLNPMMGLVYPFLGDMSNYLEWTIFWVILLIELKIIFFILKKIFKI